MVWSEDLDTQLSVFLLNQKDRKTKLHLWVDSHAEPALYIEKYHILEQTR